MEKRPARAKSTGARLTPPMEIHVETIDLRTRHEFRIARPRRQPLRNVFLSVTADGVTGLGEASPCGYYRETAELVLERIASAAPWLRSLAIRSKADLERAWTGSWEFAAPSRAAQCAIDLALWDWLARREGVSVSELAHGTKPESVTTFCTIGLSTPGELAVKLAELEGFRAIKIKAAETAVADVLRQVRKCFTGVLAVDANCAWNAHDLPARCRDLAEFEIAFLEQPLPPESSHALNALRLVLPVFADESCIAESDLDSLPPGFAGFNIKLVKCGGLTPALRMARRGRECGLQTMAGCMIESSLLIAAGCVVAQQTDFADLDGAWLLRDDPFRGWAMNRGLLSPPAGQGLGASRLANGPDDFHGAI